jgi:hypothetical protein
LLWLKVSPEEALVAVTVTESVPQVFVFDVSQTVTVALPVPMPTTVMLDPFCPAEMTFVLEILLI